jgi:hypothetical protein
MIGYFEKKGGYHISVELAKIIIQHIYSAMSEGSGVFCMLYSELGRVGERKQMQLASYSETKGKI